MSLHRRAARKDNNQKSIADTLRCVPGCIVYAVSGPGLPDLLVGYQRTWRLLEVKNPTGRNRTEPLQVEFHNTAKALELPCFVVRTPDDALAALGITATRPPYPQHCTAPKICATDGRCHADPCCID